MTQNDLSQIRAVFKEEIKEEVKKVVEDVLEQKLEEKLEQKLEEKLAPIRQQLKQIKPMSQKINKIKKDQDAILGFLDKNIVAVEKRVDRIEDRLHLSRSPLQ